METILEITEIEESHNGSSYYGMFGYSVKTNEQEIKILIDNHQCCCEDFGYFTTNDNLEDFIGAHLLGIKLTDTCLNQKVMKDKCEFNINGDQVQFVDLDTDKGTLQFAVYNSHNGYYGHDIKIESEQLKFTTTL